MGSVSLGSESLILWLAFRDNYRECSKSCTRNVVAPIVTGKLLDDAARFRVGYQINVTLVLAH